MEKKERKQVSRYTITDVKGNIVMKSVPYKEVKKLIRFRHDKMVRAAMYHSLVYEKYYIYIDDAEPRYKIIYKGDVYEGSRDELSKELNISRSAVNGYIRNTGYDVDHYEDYLRRKREAELIQTEKKESEEEKLLNRVRMYANLPPYYKTVISVDTFNKVKKALGKEYKFEKRYDKVIDNHYVVCQKVVMS